MKKITLFFISILLILNTNMLYSNQYNSGYNLANQMLTNSDKKANYNLYVNEVLKKCARITGDVHHMNDARLPLDVCQFTAGFKDRLHGTQTDVSKQCLRSNIPSDISRPNDITLSSLASCIGNTINTTSIYCPAKNFVSNTGANITYSIPSGAYPSGAYLYVNAQQNGQTCSINSVYSCRIAVECVSAGTGLDWSLKGESCACVTNEVLEFCTGTPPIGKEHCRCGKWVTWDMYNRTYEC